LEQISHKGLGGFPQTALRNYQIAEVEKARAKLHAPADRMLEQVPTHQVSNQPMCGGLGQTGPSNDLSNCERAVGWSEGSEDLEHTVQNRLDLTSLAGPHPWSLDRDCRAVNWPAVRQDR
jgi:hypothetical protein